jgi:glyoxylase I family protein
MLSLHRLFVLFIFIYDYFQACIAFIAAVPANPAISLLSPSTSELHCSIVYGGLNHAGVLVTNSEASKMWYIDVFGCTDDSHTRPKTLPYPGAFLRFGSDQIHLMELPSDDPKSGRPIHGGRDRHVAFTINNIDNLKARLEARGHPFTLSQSGRRALFCRDIDGNAYEFMEDNSII